MRLNEDTFIMPVEADGGDEGFGLYRQRISGNAVAWMESKLDEMRRGRLHPVIFRHQLSAGNFSESLPFAREAMTTSDFPLQLIANVADRALLAGYNEAPASWPLYTRLKTNTDLKDAELYKVDGGEGILPLINELGPYPEVSLTEGKYAVRVKKRGRKMLFSLEAFINDGLNAFNSTPARFGRAARRTEEYVVTAAYATDAAKAALFTVGNKNQIITANGARVSNPAFGVDGVIDALTVMANQLDADGQPIDITGAVVVYPSNLEGVAMHIKHILEIRSKVRSGDSNNEIVMSNFLDGAVSFVPNHQLRLVAQTNPDTGWFIFQNPSIGRPAIVAAKLMGHDAPDLYMKSSNAVRIGGGLADPMEGDFDNDGVAYKVRQWFGVTTVDPKSVAFSNGTGS